MKNCSRICIAYLIVKHICGIISSFHKVLRFTWLIIVHCVCACRYLLCKLIIISSIYEAETCTSETKEEELLERTEMRMLRWILEDRRHMRQFVLCPRGRTQLEFWPIMSSPFRARPDFFISLIGQAQTTELLYDKKQC